MSKDEQHRHGDQHRPTVKRVMAVLGPGPMGGPLLDTKLIIPPRTKGMSNSETGVEEEALLPAVGPGREQKVDKCAGSTPPRSVHIPYTPRTHPGYTTHREAYLPTKGYGRHITHKETPESLLTVSSHHGRLPRAS